MPISIVDKRECTGCGGCFSVCPRNSIRMIKDSSGFVYPEVNSETCINCEICKRVCPVLSYTVKETRENPKVYAAWSKDAETRFRSTSGGIFTELAKKVLQQGGIIAGAAYSDDNMVKHIIVTDEAGISLLRQSKYIQSETNEIYQHVKYYLERSKIVLFVGAPCQVAALKKYLMKDYSNLFTVDFICRGMNSPKAYRNWLDELENKYGSKVKNVWFKYKKFGWNDSPMCTRILFENGKEYICDSEKNTFMRGYLEGNLYLRPSCSQCLFKGIERESDITMADFWKVPKDIDDNLGTSMLMINTNIGAEMFEKIKSEIVYYEREFEEISKGNICFKESAALNPKSEEFLKRLDKEKFSKLISEYAPISYKKMIRKKISRAKKHIIDKLNILRG